MTPADIGTRPVVVDTDVLSMVAWSKDRYLDFEPFLVGRLVAVSFATVGELYMGADKAGWGAGRRTALDLVIARYLVLAPNDAITRMFGLAYSKFHGRLGESGVNDVWTAACALAQDPVPAILTNNRRHFELIAAEYPTLVVAHPDI
jgi:tRNA(fMet)-specific endonuclease VapC